MSLITAHRILIGTAIAFFVFLGLWEIVGYFRTSSATGDLMQGIAALVIAGVFGAYYPTIEARYRKRDHGRGTRDGA
jgi:hypothetical protein